VGSLQRFFRTPNWINGRDKGDRRRWKGRSGRGGKGGGRWKDEPPCKNQGHWEFSSGIPANVAVVKFPREFPGFFFLKFKFILLNVLILQLKT